MLIIVSGLIASGKTTVAKYIAEKINATFLRTDVLRREIYPNPTYSDDEVNDIYQRVFQQAKISLQQGKNVVLDATFSKQKMRDQAKSIAEEAQTLFLLVEVISSGDVTAKKRIEERVNDAANTSYRGYLKSKTEFEPIVENHIVIYNSGSLDETYKQVDQFLLV